MKARTRTTLLGVLCAVALVLTPSAFAYHPHDGDGYNDYRYGDDWAEDQDDFYYGGYDEYGYGRSPYDGSDRCDEYDDSYHYEHPSGLFGYWGKDAEHHRRGHRHHHLF
jgi:hypothetical protein